MRYVVPVLAGVLLACAEASAGEKAEGKIQKLNPSLLDQLTRKAAAIGTAVLVKVQSATPLAEDARRPQLPFEHPGMWGGQQVPVFQRVRCDVEQVLLGDVKSQEMTVVFRHVDLSGAWQRLMSGSAKGRAVTDEELLAEAGVKPGETYIVIVAEDRNQEAAEGEPSPVYSTVDPPLPGDQDDAVAALKDLAARIEACRTPPQPTAEQKAAFEGLVKLLASDDSEVRAKAQADMLALGPAVKGLVEEASRSSDDLEVRLRCSAVFEDMKPVAGGEPDDWAGGYVIEKTEQTDEDSEEGDEGVNFPLGQG